MHEKEKIFLHALRSLPFIGDKTLRKILASFESAEAAWNTSSLPSTLNLGSRMRETFLNRHSFIPNPDILFESLATENITLVTEDESAYPAPLKEIPDNPLLLYIRGNYDFATASPLLAVVGSRKVSSYGKEVVTKLVTPLAQAGVTIVSGLAFGVDKLAHEATLRAGGKTLAILGSGIDTAGITPATHQKLGLDITQQGALISEFPPGSIPMAGNFPLRNRIIAGLTQGTLVIEAAEKSGSLITARLALDYNREVFAVPGSVFSPLSQGTNSLLKLGAVPVTHSNDLLRILLPHYKDSSIRVSSSITSSVEQKIIALLQTENLHINALSERSNLPIHEVSSALLILELQSLVKHLGNQIYMKQ